MTKLSLSPIGIVRAMRSAYTRGVDPYNSHDAFRAKAARMIADKARRYREPTGHGWRVADDAMRDPYPLHREA